MRGALIEYSGDFLGPIPNVVMFQFNPETLTRTIEIPPRPTRFRSPRSRETTQAGEVSIEKITLKASFSAMDELGDNKALARVFGVGTRLAALEKMVRPAGKLGGLLGAALDAVGDALGLGGGDDNARGETPRQKYPRILFIWGPYRILPVIIQSMSITEQQYDFLLNPIQAEVSITMAVNEIGSGSGDTIGKGALEYSNLAKDAQAIVNLANTVEQAAELIPF